MDKVRNALAQAKYEMTELTPDEEHGLYEIETVTNSGVDI